MRVVDYCKEKGIKIPKKFHVSFSKMDKTNDDFHILPSPVIAFANYEVIFGIAFGIKWGFWGIGFWYYHIKNVEVNEV